MSDSPPSAEELLAAETQIETWLAAQLGENPILDAYERDIDIDRLWHIRVLGEEKDVFTIRFRLGQRNLHYETYVMPAPEENHEAFYNHLLRRNLKLFGAAFAIGDEDAVFLIGQFPVAHLDEDHLDRVLGSLFIWVEQFFKPALRIGFATRFGQQETS